MVDTYNKDDGGDWKGQDEDEKTKLLKMKMQQGYVPPDYDQNQVDVENHFFGGIGSEEKG